MAAPRLTGHTLLAGPNGTGKTTLALELVKGVRGLAVCDTKGVGELDHLGQRITDVKDVFRYDRVVYHARPGAEGKELEPFFEACFQRGHLVVFVDEVMHAATQSYMGRWLRACLRSGRGRGLRMLNLAQSLVGLHNDVMRESWFYVLFTLDGTDADKMRTWNLPEDVVQRVLAQPKHAFVTWDKEAKRAYVSHTAGGRGARAEARGEEGPPAHEVPARRRHAARGGRKGPGGARRTSAKATR